MLIKIFIFLSLNLITFFFLLILNYKITNFLNFYSSFTFLINSLIFNFFIVVFFFHFFKKNKNLNLFIFFFTYIFILLNKKPIFSVSLYKKIVKYKQLTLDLFNGLIQFHPYMFYISLVFLLLIFYYYFFFKKIKNTYQNKIILKILIVSLLSGGYWSFLHLVWGNWWTWDNIELLLLFFIFLYTQISHRFNKKNNAILYIFLNLFFTLLFYIFLVRFAFINSKHNFFKIDNTPTNISLFIKTSIFLFIFFLIALKIKVMFIIYKKNKIETNLLIILIFWLTLFIISNFLYKLNNKFFFCLVFCYLILLFKFIFKNNVVFIWHLFFIFLSIFLYYFKTVNVKFNTKKNNYLEFLNYTQNFFIVLFYNYTYNQKNNLFLQNNGKLNIFNENNNNLIHNFVLFNNWNTINKKVTLYNVLSSQNVSYNYFSIKKNNQHPVNLYLNSQMLKTIIPIYLIAIIIIII